MYNPSTAEEIVNEIRESLRDTRSLLNEIEGIANKTIYPFASDSERFEEIKKIVIQIKEIL